MVFKFTSCQPIARKVVLLSTLLLLCVPTCNAENRLKNLWNHGPGRLLRAADMVLRMWEYQGIDTTYIQVPERDRIVYLGTYVYSQQCDMNFPVLLSKSEMPEYFKPYLPSNYQSHMFASTNTHSTQVEEELGIDWRGLCIELPIRFRYRFHTSLGLAKNGSVWGFRIRYKNLKDMKGKVHNAIQQMGDQIDQRMQSDMDQYGSLQGNDAPITTTPTKFVKGQMDLKMFYTEGYYVFNHRKFSLAAGMYGDMIQRKSAGSLFVMGNYMQTTLGCNNMLNAKRDEFRNNKVSFGAGYGYNLSLQQGKMCIHASAIPMISLWNKLTHSNSATTIAHSSSPETQKLWEIYDTHYYDAANLSRDSGFTLNVFARLAYSYSINDRLVLNFLANYRRYLFNNSVGLHITNREFDAQLNFGYRF